MDAESFKEVFMPYSPKLYRIAYRIVGDVAEDIVQETYIKLWNKRADAHTINNTEAFAIITLRNTCLDYLRATKKESDQEIDENCITETYNLQREIELKDDVKQVEKLINKLPEQQRQIMQMKHWDDCTDEEIEQATGLSNGNIRVILSRARKTIREQFTKTEQQWILTK